MIRMTQLGTIMKRLIQFGRLAMFALLVLVSISGTALARGKAAAPAGPAEKSYATAYLLFGLCIGLGLISMLRPTNRSKPE